MLSFRRRRTMREREEAAQQRVAAAKAFVAALREAEEALASMKAANDKFYKSDRGPEQAALSALRRDRERVFIFHTVRDVAAEAPHLARLIGVRVNPAGGTMPLVAFIEHTNQSDLGAIDATDSKGDRP